MGKRIASENRYGVWSRTIRRDPCSYCGRPAPVVRRRRNGVTTYLGRNTIEHVTPRSSDDENKDHWTNLVAACRKCNGKRGSLPLLKWLLVVYHQQIGKPLAKAERRTQGLWHER